MTTEERKLSIKKRLEIPKEGKLPCVFDSDTKNEIDDQYAMAYLLKHEDRFDIQALYAEPFWMNGRSESPEDGMEQSYAEIFKVLELMDIPVKENFVFKGATHYITDREHPERCPAALDLAERAMQYSPENPLYVIATGCISNIGNALLINPDIRDNIVVVWLGGHALNMPYNDEYNLKQDLIAVRELFSCETALVHVACHGSTSHLVTSIYELERYLVCTSKMGDYLLYITRDYLAGKRGMQHYGYGTSKVMWDMGTIAYLVNPSWFVTEVVKTPTINDDCTWVLDKYDHEMITTKYIKRDPIFYDFFKRMSK